jgi:hypothetical protein
VARITVLSPLVWLSDAGTRLDGATQTVNVGDTNAGTLGAGGTVGAAGLALATVARPEVELVDGANLAVGLDVRGASVTVRNLAIRGFGNAAGNCEPRRRARRLDRLGHPAREPRARHGRGRVLRSGRGGTLGRRPRAHRGLERRDPAQLADRLRAGRGRRAVHERQRLDAERAANRGQRPG